MIEGDVQARWEGNELVLALALANLDPRAGDWWEAVVQLRDPLTGQVLAWVAVDPAQLAGGAIEIRVEGLSLEPATALDVTAVLRGTGGLLGQTSGPVQITVPATPPVPLLSLLGLAALAALMMLAARGRITPARRRG